MHKNTAALILGMAAGLLALYCPGPRVADAAVGCTLTNPAQDLKYLFSDITSYKEELRNLSKMKDGKALYAALKERLESDLDPVYETYETPYTVYVIFKGSDILGYVHGVNVPGQGGVIQVFLSADPKTGTVRRVFFQRIESAASRAFRSKDFADQFRGLTLADFYNHDLYRSADPGSEKDVVGRIKNPAPNEKSDFNAALRGVRKNLILLDFFVYDRKFEPSYRRVREALSKPKD